MKHLLAVLLTLLSAAAALAGEPPTAPMLRIETGFHTAKLKRIATDAQGRWLASASNDKTLRLWDIRDAENPNLVRTFRLPGGLGNEGKLFAVAMDPAGDWLAAGGWSKLGYEGFGNHNLYILDRATGQMRQRIKGLGNVILHLCVSPDGSRLAAVLGGGEGLRVYDTRHSFSPAFADRDYGKDSYGCAFSPDSRSLVTTCYDGQLRLYRLEGRMSTATFRKDKQTAVQGGKQPYSVAFHPAGDRIAVGFNDSTAVSVVDAERLTRLYAADIGGIDNGDLSKVAWSADGSFLFAGGRYMADGSTPIFRWADRGQGRRETWQAADTTVMDLKPLPDGSLLVGTGGPALLRYDRQGGKLFDLRPNLPDLRAHYDKFQVSADGRQVVFGLGYGGEEPACFDLDQRQLRKGQCEGSLTSPRIEASGLKIENWINEYNPTLNGEPLALEDYERSRSLAIAPDGQHFLLGTNWSLRCFDRQGKEVWQQPVPGVVWGVNISKDGRLAVAAFGDGTVRWFRLSDGEPLLSLFVFVNKDTGEAEHWIAWTPNGYYDSSPGGDSLIGWQVNNGKDRLADFFPVSQFRDRYYRPDVIAKVLETLDEGKAVAQADAASGRTGRTREAPVSSLLPPALDLLAPADGSSFSSPALTLRYRVRIHDNGPPVVAVQVQVDGRFHQRSTVERRSAAEWEGTVDVTLPARDMTLSLLAENAESAVSPPASITLRWQGGRDALKPTLYLLAVGVDEYDAAEINLDKGEKYLKYASADARDFAALMMEQAGPGERRLYRKIKTRLRTNGQADQDAVLDGLEWIERQTTANDVAMVFFAGHGKLDPHEDYYFLPKDFKPWHYTSSAVSYTNISNAVSRLRGKALFLIDTCYSGRAAGQRGGGVDITRIINDLSAAENGVIVLSATTGQQTAQERDEWGHGAFTKALLEALSGAADYVKDKAIDVAEINLYLAHRVPELTGGQQNPAVVIPKSVPDFPVLVLP